MSRTYEVYIPVVVTVTVEDDGAVASSLATIDWDGAPWMFVGEEPSIFDFDGDEWVGHGGDDASPLWEVERAAETALADKIA